MLPILIPSLIAVASVWAVGRIISRRIPKESEQIKEWHAEVTGSDFGPTFYQKALGTASKRSKEVALNVSTKLLYRLKIGTLKTDNFFAKMIQKMKHHRQNVEAPVLDEKDKVISNDLVMPTFVVSELKDSQNDESEIVSVKTIKEETVFEEEAPSKNGFESLEQQFINQLSYNPRDVSIYKKLGWLYLENNRHIQARQSFKTAVKLGSKDKMIMAKLLEMGGTIHKEGRAPRSFTGEAKAVPKVELSHQTAHNTLDHAGTAVSGVVKASEAVHKKPASAGRLVKIRKIRLTKTKV